jgi:Transposase IS66 family/IS66 C-terminal element
VHAAALLAGYSGIVQCDGYEVYEQLANPARDGGAVTLAHCWLHWRRYFFDIDKAGPAPIAREALERIAALYAIESRIRGHSAELSGKPRPNFWSKSFAGHDEGAVNWACLASLIETAKIHGIDPQVYLADVLAKLVNGWPVQKLDELLPWAWAKQQPAYTLAA